MGAYIQDIAYYLPEKIVTNDELSSEFPEWSAEKIFRKVGVRQRHVAAANQTAADMAFQAAEKLFEQGVERESIDYLLFCTQSPDYKLPTSACILQERLGLRQNIGAMDFNLGCSGYVYGLSLAKGLIAGGMAKNVLLLTGETYNKYIHPTDKGNRTIFGDGASATLVSMEGKVRIGEFVFGTNGAGFSDLVVPNGGARNPMGTENKLTDKAIENPDNIFMAGADIFAFTLKQVPELMEQVLAANQTQQDDVDLFVLHQANKYMLDFLRQKMRVAPEKMFLNLELIGNTVSSTVPIALRDAMDEHRIQQGNKVVIAGFGVGLSWAGTELFY